MEAFRDIQLKVIVLSRDIQLKVIKAMLLLSFSSSPSSDCSIELSLSCCDGPCEALTGKEPLAENVSVSFCKSMKLTLSDLSGRDSSEEKLPKLSESFAVSLTSRSSAGGIVSLEAFFSETSTQSQKQCCCFHSPQVPHLTAPLSSRCPAAMALVRH